MTTFYKINYLKVNTSAQCFDRNYINIFNIFDGSQIDDKR